MNKQEIIETLEMENDLMTFDPHTGEDFDPLCLNELNKRCYVAHKDAIKLIKSMPDSKLIWQRHGRWEQVEVIHDRKDAKIQDWQQAKCSVCGKWQTTPYMYYLKLDNYCPNCGAYMRGEQ